MPRVTQFEDLKCWQEARELVRLVYAATAEGPISKDYGMRDQLRRAAISTINNIAEGFGRFSDREFVRFLDFSSSSAVEVQSMAYAAIDLNYLPIEKAVAIQAKAERVKSLALALIKYLMKKS